jgi:uncharacterized protein YcbK (DUF882 family)
MAAPSAPHEHVVQPGQTLAKIAKRYRVDIDDLCAANDLKKSAKLQPGVKLTIPSDDDTATASKAYAVATRETHTNLAPGKHQESDRRLGSRSTSYGQYLAKPARRGWVHIIYHHGEWQGQLVAKTGKLVPKSASALSRLLSWPRTDLNMDRRLLALLGQVSDSLGGRTLRVVSGYRTTSYSSESKHPLGRACDFHVLGVPNNALRDLVRNFDNVGVGYYPNSTFIHLDVRERDTYWVDYSGPGEPPRSTPNRVAKSSDDSGGITAARAAEVMKDDSESAPHPEAVADSESIREEQPDSSPNSTLMSGAATPARLGAAKKHEMARPTGVAEPESTSFRPGAASEQAAD